MAWVLFALALAGSYLLGSVNAAVVISKFIAHDDVREHGSGNAGMTNVMRTMGFLPGLLTLVIDSSKGAVCCLLSKFVVFPFVYEKLGFEFLRPEYAVYYCGILCLIGHIYPLFFGFRGGKGVATALGVLCVCEYKTALGALAVFLIVFLISRIISLGSITACVTLPVLNIFFAERIDGAPYAVLVQCILISVISVIIIFMHRANIVRLIHKEEKKLTVKKGK